MKSGMSLLGLGIAPRLVIAAALVVLVWLLVVWALA
jgi:hypothetical protein